MSWLLSNPERPYLKAETHNQFTLMDRFRALGFVPPELTRLEREKNEKPSGEVCSEVGGRQTQKKETP
jgi:hypothetical protein